MKKLVTLFLILTSQYTLIAQSNIQGRVINENSEALVGATIILLQQQDSTMVSFALANENGLFQLDNIKEDNYIIQVSFVSYANYSEELIVDWQSPSIELKDIVLKQSTEVLQEITIKAEHIPMGISGDTISYNASAFKTRPNATVEDLLKKLPGIEVEKNGEIKAQGKTVENVLVDGKEFFGSDASIATKNLEAEAVDKVQVYDKKSEIAEFTGIDDGKEEKTINLELKEEYKQGGFGNLNVAAGPNQPTIEKPYNSKANYFRFNPKMQAAIIFSANNLNKETFSINDQIEFLGGFGNAMSSGILNLSDYQGMSKGINESMSTGLNLSYDFTEKIKLRTHYVLNRNLNELRKSESSNSFANDFSFSSLDSISSENDFYKHQLNTKLELAVNPKNVITFRNNFNWTSLFDNNSSFTNYQRNSLDQGNAFSNNILKSKSYLYENNLFLKKKYTKVGRNSIGKIAYKIQRSNSVENIQNNIQLINNNQLINQDQFYNNQLNQLNFEFSHTEPLSKKLFISSDFKTARNTESPLREYFDLVDNTRILNNQLTTNYSKVFQFQQAGFKLRRNTKKLKSSIGLYGQKTKLEGIINEGESNIENSFRHLLPFADVDLKISNGKSLTMSYQTNLEAPTLEQLLPIPNNSTANFIFLGNPNLIPSYNHKISASFNYFDQFNFISLFTNFNFTVSENRIVQQTIIDDNLFQTIQSINTDEYWSADAYMNFSSPLKALKLKYKLRARLNLAKYDSFLNDLSSNVSDHNLNFRLSFENQKTDKIYVESGLEFDFNNRKYEINPSFDQNFFNVHYFSSIEFYLPFDLVLSSDLDYYQFSNETFSGAPNYFIWSGTISKFFKEEKIELRVTANDLLNQNTDYLRFGTTNSVNESRYNNLKRYFLLGLNYKIGKTKPKSGIQIDID